MHTVWGKTLHQPSLCLNGVGGGVSGRVSEWEGEWVSE